MRERPAAPTGFIPELDGLRGLAILMVMIHRVYPRAGDTPWPIEAGWAGVDLFFVISGFLIAGILLDTRDDPDYFRNFYARRVLRIFPLFYLLVGGMLLAFPLADHDGFLEQAGSPLWYLLQLGNIPEGVLGLSPPYWLAPVWSLAIEEQFYLTFPLLVRRVDPRNLWRWLVAFVAIALVTRIVSTSLMPANERFQYLFTLCRLDTIALGCLVAVVVRTRWYPEVRARLARGLVPVLAIASIVLLATQLDRTTWFGRTFGYTVVAIAFVSLVILVLEHRGEAVTRVLRVRPLQYLGKLCFGLYLLHRPADTVVSALVARTDLDGTSLVWIPVKLAVAVGFATISWRVLERPFLRLKDRFASSRHPSRIPLRATVVGLVLMLLLAACGGSGDPAVPVDGNVDGARGDGSIAVDAAPRDPDAAMPAAGRVLYPEGSVHSPVTADVVTALAAIAQHGAAGEPVFAKVGDSITAAASFVTCFGGAGYDLGSHGALAPTLRYFQGGDAAGTNPYARSSQAATGGWTTADVLSGSPDALDRELAAIAPRYGVVLLGTNDVRYGRTVDAFGADLWTAVDRMIEVGTIPILSTMPAMHGDPDANARIPLFDRVIRALAQGRSIPLVDFHLALAGLPNEGLGSDGIHPSVAPEGACALTANGLAYGYNTRNLVTLAALDRARRAHAGEALDPTAPRRSGAGTHADPFRGALPLLDLGDTRAGESTFATYPGCGLTASGHEVVYQLDLPAAATLDAYVIDRGAVDVDVALLGGVGPDACVASGDHGASATLGPGPVVVVVDSHAATTEGEFLLVVQAR